MLPQIILLQSENNRKKPERSNTKTIEKVVPLNYLSNY